MLDSASYRPISFKLGVMIDTTEHLCSATLSILKSQMYDKANHICAHLFRTINIQGREPYLGDFINYTFYVDVFGRLWTDLSQNLVWFQTRLYSTVTFNIDLCLDVFEQIYFKT